MSTPSNTKRFGHLGCGIHVYSLDVERWQVTVDEKIVPNGKSKFFGSAREAQTAGFERVNNLKKKLIEATLKAGKKL